MIRDTKTPVTISLPATLTEGPEWLSNRRRASMKEFSETPLPRRGLHLWRYTDPARFLGDDSPTEPEAFTERTESSEQYLREQFERGQLSGLVLDRNGRTIEAHCAEAAISQGVIVGSLSEAASGNSQVATKLYELINASTGKFEALNGALWQDGVFIYVPKGTAVAEPIHLLRSVGSGAGNYYPRLLVIVEENAEVMLVDEYVGGPDEDTDGRAYINAAVELFGGDGSKVRYVALQGQNSGCRNYLTHRASIGRDALMLTVPLCFGGGESKQNFGVILAGRGANSNMYGLLFGGGYQHFDNHTLHHHSANQSLSNIDFKVVLNDRANSAYTGLIRIDTDAKDCEAYQTNRNLLLSASCKAETIPELEILNEDVSCSHGATVGPVDPEQVFYLQGRGIPETEAVRLIVSGFVSSTLKMVPEDMRGRIEKIVHTRLQAL